MRVAELIELLKNEDPSAEVMIVGDMTDEDGVEPTDVVEDDGIVYIEVE